MAARLSTVSSLTHQRSAAPHIDKQTCRPAGAAADSHRQAKDEQLIVYATEIRLRAERRCGELLRAMMELGERTSNIDTLARGNDLLPRERPTLADFNISKMQSSRWQKLAGLSEADFEAKVGRTKEVAAWIKLGNKPDPYEPPPQQPQVVALVLFFGPKATATDTDADQAKLGSGNDGDTRQARHQQKQT